MARKLLLAGVNRWPSANDELEIDQTLTHQGDAATFQVAGAEPMRGEEVIIEDDDLPGEDKRLFAGIVVSAETVDHIGEGADRREIWAVECDDYRNQMDRYLVNEIYEGWTSDAIAIDLLQKYCPGFTWNGVQTAGAIVEKIWFDDVYPSEALRQLCDYTGRIWYVDYYKDVKFFDPEELSEASPMVLEPGGRFDNFKMSIDIQGLANRVKVKGGTMLSDPLTVKWVADGQARYWPLPFKPHEVSLEISEVPKSVGIENVHEEADYDFLFSYQEKYLRCSAQTATPVNGATMELIARQSIPVITVVDDIESQDAVAAVQGGDGVYEVVITDTSIQTLDAAEAAGNAYLRDHANPTVKGSFETAVPGWRPGQLVEIHLPGRGADGVYMVRRVKIRPFWPANPSLWSWTVEFGGRLLGIPELLKALLSAEQKRDLAETALLQKYAYGQDETSIEDEIVATPVELPMTVEQSKVVAFTPEKAGTDYSDTATATADFNGTHTDTEATGDAVKLAEVAEFQDDFERADLGTSWEHPSDVEGEATIENGEMRLTAGSTRRMWARYVDGTVQVKTIEFDARADTAYSTRSDFGCVFNWDGQLQSTGAGEPLNGYRLYWNVWSSPNIFSVTKFENGNKADLGTYEYPQDDAQHHVKITVSESGEIGVFLDGQQIISVVDTTYISGYVGFCAREGSTATPGRSYYDNIIINAEYASSGTYTHNILNPSQAVTSAGGAFTFAFTTPAGTSASMDYRRSFDGGNTWEDWVLDVASGVVPFPAGTDVSNARFQWRANLSTTDVTVTPSLDEASLNVDNETAPVEFATIGSRLNVVQPPTGEPWAAPEYATSEDGVTYGAYQAIEPLKNKGLVVPYPGHVRLRALGRIKAYNYKRPFDETLVVCGVVEVG